MELIPSCIQLLWSGSNGSIIVCFIISVGMDRFPMYNAIRDLWDGFHMLMDTTIYTFKILGIYWHCIFGFKKKKCIIPSLVSSLHCFALLLAFTNAWDVIGFDIRFHELYCTRNNVFLLFFDWYWTKDMVGKICYLHIDSTNGCWTNNGRIPFLFPITT